MFRECLKSLTHSQADIEVVGEAGNGIRKEYQYTGSTWQWIGDTRYVYDGMRVIQERDSNNTPTVSYSRGVDLSGSLEGAGGIGGLLARSHGYSGSTGDWSTHNFYHADGGGNMTHMINSAQSMTALYRYDPFGRTTYLLGTMATANTYRFSSKEIHSFTGMYYYGYRFYHPFTQRWINRDPLGEPGHETLRLHSARGGTGLPSEVTEDGNMYRFVGNSPTVAVDRDGRERGGLIKCPRCGRWIMTGPSGSIDCPCGFGTPPPYIPDCVKECGRICFLAHAPMRATCIIGCIGAGPAYKACVLPCLGYVSASQAVCNAVCILGAILDGSP